MFPFSLCMLYTVVLFRSLGRVPAAKVARQVTGDTAHAQDILAVTYRTTAVDDSLVATIVTSIYRVLIEPYPICSSCITFTIFAMAFTFFCASPSSST